MQNANNIRELLGNVKTNFIVDMYNSAWRNFALDGYETGEIYCMDEFGDDGQFDETESLFDIIRYVENGCFLNKFSTDDRYFRRNWCKDFNEPYLESCGDPVKKKWIDLDALAKCIAEHAGYFRQNFGFDEFVCETYLKIDAEE